MHLSVYLTPINIATIFRVTMSNYLFKVYEHKLEGLAYPYVRSFLFYRNYHGTSLVILLRGESKLHLANVSLRKSSCKTVLP